MNGVDFLRFGCTVTSLCEPEYQLGHPPRTVFIEQRREARVESKRHHPRAAAEAQAGVCWAVYGSGSDSDSDVIGCPVRSLTNS
jgi:hypothetical protein